MDYIEELRDAIRRIHDADATWVQTVPVKGTFHGRTSWEGNVEVFDLHNHRAQRAYAWAHDDRLNPSGPRDVITVLHIPPATTPQKAVRLAISGENYREKVN